MLASAVLALPESPIDCRQSRWLVCSCRHELSHPPSTPEAVTPAQGRPSAQFPAALSSSADGSTPQAAFPASPGKWPDPGDQNSSRGSQHAELAYNRGSSLSVPKSPYAGTQYTHACPLSVTCGGHGKRGFSETMAALCVQTSPL